MCVGLAPARAADPQPPPPGPGNVLVLLGALTGRDGIGGASVLASAELGEGDEAKRPTVQIGDPFAEKKLLECCLELLDRGLLVSLQDLGAAGLTSSASEMASKGGVGLDIDVGARAAARAGDGAVRDHGLRVAGADAVRGRARARRARCWRSASTGRCWRRRSARSPSEPRLRVLAAGQRRRRHARRRLVDDCPLYDLEPGAARARRSTPRRAAPARPGPSRRARRCSRCCARRTSPPAGPCSSSTTRSSSRAPSAGPRRPTRPCSRSPTARDRGLDRRQRPARRCDPRAGAAEAVFECAANLACVGAEPLGLTNCLNFGNPEKPHVAWQLTEAVEGLAEACEALGVPVVGGNVSLYNEAPTGPIFPTPVVGMVGRLPDAGARRAARVRRRGRRDRARRLRSPARSRARSSPSCAARPASGRSPNWTPPPSARRTTRSATRCAPVRCRAPTTSPRAASRSRSPSAASPAAIGAEVELARRRRGWPVRRGPGSGVHRLRRRRGGAAPPPDSSERM